MELIFYTALAGAGISILTEVGKHYSVKVSDLMLGLAIVCGVIYAAFTTYLPAALQQSTASFVKESLGSAVLIYVTIKKGAELVGKLRS